VGTLLLWKQAQNCIQANADLIIGREKNVTLNANIGFVEQKRYSIRRDFRLVGKRQKEQMVMIN
jgi:hypothetical protein